MPDAKGAEVGCLPPTPSPCSADGICRPNQASFGYSPTRWRPWPGDPQPKQPTPAEEQETKKEEDEMELQPFEHPAPEKEDTRGPAKTKSFSPAEEAPVPAVPEEAPFPEIGQQENIPAVIRLEDAPPKLPRKLRRLASANRLGQLSTVQTAQSSYSDRNNRNTSSNSSQHLSAIQPRQRLPRRSPRGTAIAQVSGEQRVNMNSQGHVRRGSAQSTAKPSITGVEHSNQQAIYYRTINRRVSNQTK